MPTVADRIAEFLAEKGVTHAFGIIGAGNAALFEAIARLAETEIVCCHHEAAAVMAATYWGRTRRSVGCAIVTTGAGSSNAITGALAAQMDSAPVLIISGNEPSRYSGDKTRIRGVQGFSVEKDCRPFVKRMYTAPHGILLPFRLKLESAWEHALEPRPGAVWFDIARDAFNAVE